MAGLRADSSSLQPRPKVAFLFLGLLRGNSRKSGDCARSACEDWGKNTANRTRENPRLWFSLRFVLVDNEFFKMRVLKFFLCWILEIVEKVDFKITQALV